MKARGYSLVEIIVVLGIVSILLALSTLRFAEYARRYRTEAQTRMIYAELLQARSNAFFQRRGTRMKFYRERFEVYSSTADGGSGAAPIRNQELKYPIKVNGTGTNVDFDEKGMAVNLRSICIDDGEPAGALDSVVIATIRLSIGKKNPGGNCESGDITIR